jgi:dihydropyrimidinase
MDLAVVNGTVVGPAGVKRADLGVRGERLVAIEPPGALDATAARTIDATDCLVLPGAIDVHCHYNLPVEGLRSESQAYSTAASYGGTTTVVDFALQEPPNTLHGAIEEKKAEAQGQMAVDYGLHAILAGEISFEVLEEIGDVIRAGVPSIKTFTTYGWMVDDGHRWGAMLEVAEHGGISVVHAEDDAIANWMTKKYLREGKTHGAYISETRGPLVEEAAVRRVMLLAERSGSPLYILHMAAGSGVAALAEARAKGLPFYGETLIAYLSFTSDVLWNDEQRGLLWNSFPTIKSADDQAQLWAAVANDSLQVVSSDHCAFNSSDRYAHMGTTIDAMQSGQAAVELRVPVLFDLAVNRGKLSINRFVEIIATNPAKIMGLYPQKGQLAIGSDADIIVIDPSKRWTVRQSDLHMSVDYSCWEGWELQGKVDTTILRGTVLVDHGNFVGPAGDGRFVPRTLLPELTGRSPDPTATFQSAQVAAPA